MIWGDSLLPLSLHYNTCLTALIRGHGFRQKMDRMAEREGEKRTIKAQQGQVGMENLRFCAQCHIMACSDQQMEQ